MKQPVSKDQSSLQGSETIKPDVQTDTSRPQARDIGVQTDRPQARDIGVQTDTSPPQTQEVGGSSNTQDGPVSTSSNNEVVPPPPNQPLPGRPEEIFDLEAWLSQFKEKYVKREEIKHPDPFLQNKNLGNPPSSAKQGALSE